MLVCGWVFRICKIDGYGLGVMRNEKRCHRKATLPFISYILYLFFRSSTCLVIYNSDFGCTPLTFSRRRIYHRCKNSILKLEDKSIEKYNFLNRQNNPGRIWSTRFKLLSIMPMVLIYLEHFC